MLALRLEPSTQINPFRSWVPSWLQVVVAFTILIPVLLVNGAYTGSNIDISGSLGVMSEDINMAYYATSVGMAIAYLVIPKIKQIATTKTLIIIVLLFQIVLSLICANTEYIGIIIACSFLIGYFKAFSLVEVVTILTPVLSPSETRNEFYAKFYPITLACGQLSLILTGELTYLYKWQYMYYFMILLLLIACLAIVICMTYARKLEYIPIKEIDWMSLFLISACFMCIISVATYGKANNWFTSPYIVVAALLIPTTGWIFLRKQLLDKTLVDMSIIKNRNSVISYLLSFALMFFASFSVLVSTYVTAILKLESAKVTELYIYMLPGFLVGGIICYYAYLKETRMMWLMFLGFLCFTLSIVMLYFQISPIGVYQDLYIPMFLRGLGMLVLFASLAIYAIYGLNSEQQSYNTFFMVSCRSALAPAIGSSILTNWLYHCQYDKYIGLIHNLDLQNMQVASQVTESINKSVLQGWSIEDAERISTVALHAKVQLQATMLSIKEILGWMIVLGVALLVIIMLYFFQFKPVKLIRTGRDMLGV